MVADALGPCIARILASMVLDKCVLVFPEDSETLCQCKNMIRKGYTTFQKKKSKQNLRPSLLLLVLAVKHGN